VPQLVHHVDQRRIPVEGASLHAEARGPDSGPAVILMGSLASDVTSWEPQIAALADAGFHAVAFDYRGHGRSSAGAGRFSLELFQNDLRAVVASFALRRPHLVGLSLGGMVALGAALAAGNDYARMVIASTRADMPEPLASAWAERARAVREQGVEAIADETLERWFTEGFRRAHPEALARVRRMIVRTDRNAYADCIDIVRTIDLMERLRQVGQPVLYLTGEQDTASPPGLMREMQQRTPGAGFATIPGAAHLPTIEQPAAFNRLMLEFLGS